jgi:uncharacterized membrane-anchored protein
MTIESSKANANAAVLSPPVLPKQVPGWRFWLPLAAQALLILVVPGQAIYTHVAGRTVVLQTAPVDPYDFFRGYYVTLSYDISSPDTFKTLPGWDAVLAEVEATPNEPTDQRMAPSRFDAGQEFYVVLQAPNDLSAQPPQAWKPVRVSLDRPTDLSDQQVALKGTYQYNRVTYGLETYYIPEDQRNDINTRIGELQTAEGPAPFVVEVKVDPTGKAVPLGFWLSSQPYRF